MRISLVAFDDFTDIDLFLMWDLLNRVRQPDWNVSIVGEKEFHLSSNGLQVSTHGPLAEANRSDVVLFASGKGTRRKMVDPGFLGSFRLDATRRLIGSQCSGALLLARLGFLDGDSRDDPSHRAGGASRTRRRGRRCPTGCCRERGDGGRVSLGSISGRLGSGASTRSRDSESRYRCGGAGRRRGRVRRPGHSRSFGKCCLQIPLRPEASL